MWTRGTIIPSCRVNTSSSRLLLGKRALIGDYGLDEWAVVVAEAGSPHREAQFRIQS